MEYTKLLKLLGLSNGEVDYSEGVISLDTDNRNLNNALTVLGRDPETFQELWQFLRHPSKEQIEAHQAILGKELSKRLTLKLMGTLTPNGKEFRLWDSIPHYLSSEHVDSCGGGYVMDVGGNRNYVAGVKDIICPPSRISPLTDPRSGVLIYLAAIERYAFDRRLENF